LASDLLVMADGHCLVNHSLAACGAKAGLQSAMQAATLETLVNLVAAGYGTTLVPALAADGMAGRGVELRPLLGGSARVIRLASRPGFPRPQALRAVAKVVRKAVPRQWVS
jgi:LysR family hydrogen peroxide-inducible transcriptional activator